MLNEQTAARVLAAALETGGDFAEIFYEDTQTASLQMLSARVEEAVAGRDHGAGIRVFREFGSVYVYTNDTSLEGLKRRPGRRRPRSAVSRLRTPRSRSRPQPSHPFIQCIPPSDVSAVRKAEILRAAYHAAKDYDPRSYRSPRRTWTGDSRHDRQQRGAFRERRAHPRPPGVLGRPGRTGEPERFNAPAGRWDSSS